MNTLYKNAKPRFKSQVQLSKLYTEVAARITTDTLLNIGRYIEKKFKS